VQPTTDIGKRLRLFALAAIAALTLVAAGCGSDDSGDSGDGSSGQGGKGVSEASKAFDSLLGPSKLKMAGEPFDASKARGKTLFYLNTDDSIPITTTWRDVAEQALERYGVKIVNYDGKGSASEYNKAMRQAIASGADAIFNMAINPPLVQQQIKAAAAAGIPVVTGADGLPDVRDTKTYVEGLTAGVSYDYNQVGRVLAQWFASDSEGEGKALFISNDDQPSSSYVVSGFESAVDEFCPNCEVTVKDVPAAQVTTSLPTLVRTALQRDPEIDYVIPGYDFNVPVIESALRQGNLTDRVKIGSWNAVPAVMQSLQREQSPVAMELGAPNNWFSYAIADTVLRILSDDEPVVWGTEASNFMGFRTFTKESVADMDVSDYDDAEIYGLPDSEVESAFEGLWGGQGG
jgi:ribose transport system substrate-binding protein